MPLVITRLESGYTDVNIHTCHQQDQLLETRHVPATIPGLKRPMNTFQMHAKLYT